MRAREREGEKETDDSEAASRDDDGSTPRRGLPTRFAFTTSAIEVTLREFLTLEDCERISESAPTRSGRKEGKRERARERNAP